MTEIPKYFEECSEAQQAALEAYNERMAICALQDDVTDAEALELAMQSANAAFEAVRDD